MNRPPRLVGWVFGLLAAVIATGCATPPPPEAAVSAPAPTATAPVPAPTTITLPRNPAPAKTTDAAVIVPDEVSPLGSSTAVDAPGLPGDLVVRDLWFRIRAGFGMPDLNTDLVRDHEQELAGLIEAILYIDARADQYPNARWEAPHEFWDDLIAWTQRVLKRPGMLEALLRGEDDVLPAPALEDGGTEDRLHSGSPSPTRSTSSTSMVPRTRNSARTMARPRPISAAAKAITYSVKT